eukprot:5434459-Karenia_brevis.AAC.1
MLNDAHGGIKNSEIDTHAVWNMFFQGKLGFPPEVNNSSPHDGIGKDKIDAGLTRPRGGIMFVAGA